MASKGRPSRRPALGGALGPTREDAQSSQEVVFEYSQQLNQQVVALESENLELLDSRRALEARVKSMSERVSLLEKENGELRDAGFATFQERNYAVNHAQDVMRAKQGEVNLLRHTADQHRSREEALATNNARLSGIAERLQGERSQLQRQVMSLEATAASMQAEIAQQANTEAQAALVHRDLDRQVNSLTVQKMRLDQEMGVRHVEVAHLRHTREELNGERNVVMQLREELMEAAQDKARMKEEAHKMGQIVSALHIEVAQIQGVKEMSDADGARLHDALSRESALAASLRRRITELEDMVQELRRGNMALEGENGTLRSAVTRAQAEVGTCLEASNKLVQEKSGVELLADEQATKRIELERRLATSTAECGRLSKQNHQLQADNQELQQKAQKLEADNVVLRGQLRGQEVVLRGLQGEHIDETIRVQHAFNKELENKALHQQALHQQGVRTPSPPQSPMPPPAVGPAGGYTPIPFHHSFGGMPTPIALAASNAGIAAAVSRGRTPPPANGGSAAAAAGPPVRPSPAGPGPASSVLGYRAPLPGIDFEAPLTGHPGGPGGMPGPGFSPLRT